MSETLLLILLAAVVLLIIFGVRVVIKSRKIKPMSPRIEAALRIGLCILFAFVAFVIYHTLDNAWDAASAFGFVFAALIIYAVSNLIFQLITKLGIYE